MCAYDVLERLCALCPKQQSFGLKMRFGKNGKYLRETAHHGETSIPEPLRLLLISPSFRVQVATMIYALFESPFVLKPFAKVTLKSISRVLIFSCFSLSRHRLSDTLLAHRFVFSGCQE